MPDDLSAKDTSFQRMIHYLKHQIIDEAPEEIAICEFDCRKGQCQHDEWENCGRRIRKGAGELFPDLSNGAGS